MELNDLSSWKIHFGKIPNNPQIGVKDKQLIRFMLLE